MKTSPKLKWKIAASLACAFLLIFVSSASASLVITGEKLRLNPALRDRLAPGGPLPVDGLQIGPADGVRAAATDPSPWTSYFVDYDDRFDDTIGAGRLGGVRVLSQPCITPVTAVSGNPANAPGGMSNPPYIGGPPNPPPPPNCVGPNCPKIGEVIVCKKAYSDEGTSRHYFPYKRTFKATPKLAQEIHDRLNGRGIPCKLATAWTTDAPYRETHEKQALFVRKGAGVVEMETSALYMVAGYRGVESASVLVVGDSIVGSAWSPHFHEPAIRTTLDRIGRELLAFLSKSVSL